MVAVTSRRQPTVRRRGGAFHTPTRVSIALHLLEFLRLLQQQRLQMCHHQQQMMMMITGIMGGTMEAQVQVQDLAQELEQQQRSLSLCSPF